MKIDTILVPTDFSPDADEAFETALQFAAAYGARLELLHAYDFGQWVTISEVVFAETLTDKIRLEAQARLRPLVARARESGIEASAHVEFGDPSSVIVDRANETNANLIVMGTRGHGAVKRFLVGSVAARTLRLAPCAVMTVNAERVVEDAP